MGDGPEAIVDAAELSAVRAFASSVTFVAALGGLAATAVFFFLP